MKSLAPLLSLFLVGVAGSATADPSAEPPQPAAYPAVTAHGMLGGVWRTYGEEHNPDVGVLVGGFVGVRLSPDLAAGVDAWLDLGPPGDRQDYGACAPRCAGASVVGRYRLGRLWTSGGIGLMRGDPDVTLIVLLAADLEVARLERGAVTVGVHIGVPAAGSDAGDILEGLTSATVGFTM